MSRRRWRSVGTSRTTCPRRSGEDDFCIGAVSKVLVGNEGGGGVADGLEVTEDLILIRMI
jgi:hypothetical protein